MARSPVTRKDLNLLTVLEALHQEKSVSRAAVRLNLTQSALSHALSRLRDNFGDELFVRAPGGIEPTAFTQRIMPEVTGILGATKQVFESRGVFDPAVSDRMFRIGVPEYAGFTLLGELYALLEKTAPHVRILTLNLVRSEGEDVLRDNRADLIVGRFHVPAKAYDYQDLFADDFVCVGGRESKWIRNGKISLDNYLKAPHLNISLVGQFRHHRIDRELAALGKERGFRMTVSNIGLAFHLVRDSDMLLTVHTRIARPLAKTLGLKIAKLPFKSPVYETRQIWHRRYADDPGHKWLRDMVRKAAD
jgi:DNA-binding transcriptional LysR family regulator